MATGRGRGRGAAGHGRGAAGRGRAAGAARLARRLYPIAIAAWERWQRLSPEEKDRYRRKARDYARRGREAAERRRSSLPGRRGGRPGP